jgi:hypothetical protein
VGNAAARAFYAGLGLAEYPSKVFYRLTRRGRRDGWGAESWEAGESAL